MTDKNKSKGILVGGSNRFALQLAAILKMTTGIDLSSIGVVDVPRLRSKDWEVNHRSVQVRTGGTVFGPSFGPSKDWAHESRQVRRHSLFLLAFQHISRLYPGESRRVRRYIARQRAHHQYRLASAGLKEEQ